MVKKYNADRWRAVARRGTDLFQHLTATRKDFAGDGDGDGRLARGRQAGFPGGQHMTAAVGS